MPDLFVRMVPLELFEVLSPNNFDVGLKLFNAAGQFFLPILIVRSELRLNESAVRHRITIFEPNEVIWKTTRKV